MTSRIRGIENDLERDPDSNRPRSNYYEKIQDSDPFPDPVLLQPAVVDETAYRAEISAMFDRAKQTGFPPETWDKFETLICQHGSEFRTSFSSSPAKVSPLRIDLTTDDQTVRVKLRSYLADQRSLKSSLVADLQKHDLVYPNPTAKWASAALIV